MPYRDYKSKTIKIHTSPFISKIKGEIQSLIQQNQYDFYEQEVVEVIDILLREDNLPKDNGVKNHRYYGAIKGRWVENKQQSILPLGEVWILPLDPNIKRYPVIGENVVCVNHIGRTYYTSVVNINNNPNNNKLVGLSSAGKGTQRERYTIYEQTKPEHIHRNFNVKANPGDFILQGRYGNSINLGAHQIGQSSIKLVAGHNPKNNYDIIKDAASIYIQDGGTVQIENPNPNFSDNTIMGKKIVLDADYIVLNAKQNIKIQSGNETHIIGKVLELSHNPSSQFDDSGTYINQTDEYLQNLEEKFHNEVNREITKCIDAFMQISDPLQEDFEMVVDLVNKVVETPGNIIKAIQNFRKVNHEPTVKFTEYDRLMKELEQLRQQMDNVTAGETALGKPDPVGRAIVVGKMVKVIRDLSNPSTYLRFDIQMKKEPK